MRNLKLNIGLSLPLLAAFSTAFAAASIPAQFQGVWTPSAAECNTYKQEGVTDQGVNIGTSAYQQYETGCDLQQVVRADRISFTGRFLCNVEGNTSSETNKFTLSNGVLRVNNSQALRRCK
ncbi:hypothetical protein WN982_40710 [Paraburkholderia sp. IMGN_8]|uniref:hypothetical protein n=1 Tax=Paraburkholderia sp. IMGN_8 TaxID=3136564 RepID=UPI003100D9B7